MALDDKTGGTLSQDDIDKLMGGDSEGKKDAGLDQDKLAEDWAQALESGAEIEEGKPFDKAARKATFTELDETRQAAGPAKDLDFILDIPLEVTVEMGRTRMLINDLLQIGQGSVIELNRLAGEPLDILINNKLIARGEVVVVSEKFGIRITDIVSPLERVKRLA
jgi:flagellar motor switch protein FliN/FliY